MGGLTTIFLDNYRVECLDATDYPSCLEEMKGKEESASLEADHPTSAPWPRGPEPEPQDSAGGDERDHPLNFHLASLGETI